MQFNPQFQGNKGAHEAGGSSVGEHGLYPFKVTAIKDETNSRGTYALVEISIAGNDQKLFLNYPTGAQDPKGQKQDKWAHRGWLSFFLSLGASPEWLAQFNGSQPMDPVQFVTQHFIGKEGIAYVYAGDPELPEAGRNNWYYDEIIPIPPQLAAEIKAGTSQPPRRQPNYIKPDPNAAASAAMGGQLPVSMPPGGGVQPGMPQGFPQQTGGFPGLSQVGQTPVVGQVQQQPAVQPNGQQPAILPGLPQLGGQQPQQTVQAQVPPQQPGAPVTPGTIPF